MSTNGNTLTKQVNQQAFLTAYSKAGTVTKACELCSISRDTIYRWRQEDPSFTERMEQAHAQFGDYLQDLALQKVQRLESKDNLLHLAMLNAHVPELYRPERGVTHDNRQVHIHYNFPEGVNPPQQATPVPESVDAEVRELPDSGHPDATDSVTDTDA